MITVEGLTKSYNGKVVVDQVTFTLMENTATALIGPNGAGKTTILSMLTGLLTPTKGSVTLSGGGDIRSEIGFLPQYPQFFSWQTAKEALALYGGLNGLPKKEAAARIDEVLTFVGLAEAKGKKIGTFSGGMKQRLGIAQAIIHKPKLLLLDEPVSALDPVGRKEMMELLKKLQKETTILYSTHILNDAEKMTNQVLFLKNGQLVEQGSLIDVEQKYAAPKIEVKFTNESAAAQFVANYKDATQDGLFATVMTNEINKEMASIMNHIQPLSEHVVKVERKTANLEEIFLKVAESK